MNAEDFFAFAATGSGEESWELTDGAPSRSHPLVSCASRIVRHLIVLLDRAEASSGGTWACRCGRRRTLTLRHVYRDAGLR